MSFFPGGEVVFELTLSDQEFHEDYKDLSSPMAQQLTSELETAVSFVFLFHPEGVLHVHS